MRANEEAAIRQQIANADNAARVHLERLEARCDALLDRATRAEARLTTAESNVAALQETIASLQAQVAALTPVTSAGSLSINMAMAATS